MKRLKYTLLIITIALSAQSQNIIQVDANEFRNLIKEKEGVLLDVRTLHEYNNGYIENAGQLNFFSFGFKEKLLLLPKEQAIYLYCKTGHRSIKAAQTLIKNGYTKVYNLEHGIMDWELNELPIIISPNAKPDKENKFSIEQYNTLINSKPLVFIDFYAPWCTPCISMMPLIDSLKIEYFEQIAIVKINVDASKKLIKELELNSVPYFTLHSNGKNVFEHRGIITQDELMVIFGTNIAKQK